jgi:RNA polymerase sigma factor (sigma-70 family)
MSETIEDLLRRLTPQVLGVLTRKYGVFDLCEDAVQEALLAAATQWPSDGVPDNPRGWLVSVGSRRLVDMIRSDSARRRREDATEAIAYAPAADDEPTSDRDDSLRLLFLCCHPALTPPSQIALTLRSVGGLSTAAIAAAFLVPEATMSQRITRAKARLSETGARFTMPSAQERPDRLAAVLHVLYLIFNEGYATTSGPTLTSTELTGEAIRLTRDLHRLLPDDGEVIGLLALMLLTEARRPARMAPDGSLIPLVEQDRSRWTRAYVQEGVALISDALTRTVLGPYQLQAAIAAIHDEAADAESTDWAQILALYAMLESIAPNPMVTLNRAVALAMVRGPEAGLATLDGLDTTLIGHHRLHAVRAHLLELAGRTADARDAYLAAGRATTSAPERRYLEGKALRL